jgi:hypothetical protein
LIFCSRRAREAGNPASGQKGRGSGGRNFCPPAEAKPRRPAHSEQKPSKKFSFPFRRKNPVRAKEKQRKLFCWLASVSERRRGESVTVSFKKGSDFVK